MLIPLLVIGSCRPQQTTHLVPLYRMLLASDTAKEPARPAHGIIAHAWLKGAACEQ
jgi:hypothetical protein